MRILRTAALLALSAVHASLLWRAITVGTMETIDSPSYLHASPHRPPLYPLLLDIVELLPGDLHQTLHLVQLALGGAAIFLLMRSLHRRFDLDILVTLAISLFLAMPYYRWQWLGNFVMSEGLAYPLFLICMYQLLESFSGASLRRLGWFFVAAIVLFLTRKQFLFVFPIGFFAALYFALQSRSWRVLFAASGMTLVALGVAGLVSGAVSTMQDRQLPLTGIQLLPLPLYMLDGQLPKSLTREEEKFVSAAWSALDEADMTRAAFERSKILHGNLARHYASNFSTSVQKVILPLASQQLLGRIYDREDWRDLEGFFTEEEARIVDSFLLGIWKKLVLAKPAQAASMYFDNVITHIGGSMLLLFYVGIAVSAAFFAFTSHSWIAALLTAVLLLHFGNFLFTGLFEPMYPRYAFYTENLLFLVLVSTIIWLQRQSYWDVMSKFRGGKVAE